LVYRAIKMGFDACCHSRRGRIKLTNSNPPSPSTKNSEPKMMPENIHLGGLETLVGESPEQYTILDKLRQGEIFLSKGPWVPSFCLIRLDISPNSDTRGNSPAIIWRKRAPFESRSGKAPMS
jgi:hypothetical protein